MLVWSSLAAALGQALLSELPLVGTIFPLKEFLMNHFSSWNRFTLTLLLLTVLLVGLTGQALAVVVTTAAPDGWAAVNVRADATVAITTAQPRAGNGSLEFTTNSVTPGQDKADLQKLWDASSFPARTLAGLTALSYEYYRASSSTTANHFAPVFRLYVADATVGSPTFGKFALLIWEPVYNSAAPIPTDQWVTQNILNGKFWMFVPGGQSIPSGVVQNYNATLSDWLAGGVTGQPGDPAPINIDANTLVVGVNVGVGSGWGATFRGFVDNVTLQWGADEVHANFEVDQCTTVCYADAVNGNDANSGQTPAAAKKSIQAAIDAVQPGGQVRVLPGTYNEVASNRFVLGVNGPHQFGLFIAKSGVTILGVDGSDSPITDATAVLATVNTNATNNFGYSGIFVEGDNVTIQGVRIGPNTPSNNKTIEVICDGFTLRDVHIAVPGGGAVYFGDWRYDTVNNVAHIQSYLIEENWFDLGGLLSINNGAGVGGAVSGRVIQSNTFTMNGATYPAISLTGSGTTVPWFTYSVGGAVIQGNNFSGSTQYIRSRGTVASAEFDWTSYWYNNTYDKAVVALVGAYPPFDVRSYTYTAGSYTFPNTRRIGAVIQGEVDNAQPTDTVLVKAATYVEQVVVAKTLQLIGESGAAFTFIQAPATIPPASNPDSTIIKIAGAGIDVEVTGFTVTGPGPTGCGGIGAGLFVRDGANANIHDNVIRDIRDNPISGCQNGVAIQVGRAALSTTGAATIRNNTIVGYQKNGVTVSSPGSGALVENNLITGAGAVNFIAQNGVQVSSGATATIRGNTISGHSYTPFSWVSTGVLVYDADANTEGNTLSQNQVGIYHIDGNGVHDGNLISATGAGTGSPGYWGIVADDPPPGRLPSAFEDGAAIAAAAASTANAVMAATPNTKTIRVVNNELDSDGSTGGVGIEADGGYGDKDIDFTATNNYVRNWASGIVLYQCVGYSYCTSSDFVDATVQLNSITGNSNGLVSDTDDFTSNSELNWWGAASGPNSLGADTATGNTDFTPWLCDGTDTSAAVGFQPNLTTTCDGLGDLTITKVVDWSGAPPATGQSFELCITGPSYPAGDCQTTSGGAVTWSGLQVGDYTVTESDPGPNWSVTLPGVVSVADTQPAQATVTNTLRPGALTVEKIIDWQGVTPIPGVSFSICISGPSHSTPVCQNTSGGALAFGPLVPGSYTVSETPGSHWVATITSSPVEVAPLQTAQATVHNKYVGPALECALLDNFNRANTTRGLGGNWTGATNTYRIDANQAQPLTTAGTIFWNRAPRTFGADQVACMQLATIDPGGQHHTLILKAQATNNYAKGMILVAYDAVNQRVMVETIQPGQSGWAMRLVIPGAFANGDVLGARALADGSVRVYKNGVLIGAAATSSFFVNRGGRIGAWCFQTSGARFDDFGGGNTPSSMVSDATVDSPSEDTASSITNSLYLPAVQR